MDPLEQNALLVEMEAVLTQERDALLEGRLGDLSDIGDRKQALSDAIEDADLTRSSGEQADTLARVSLLATRNRELMSEASEALRTTMQRVQELQKIASGEDVYTRDGTRRFGNGSSATLHRRA